VLRIGTITNSSANAQVMNLDYRLNGTRTIDSGAAGLTVRTIGSTSGTSGRTITKNGAGTLTVNGFGGQASGLMSYAITNGTVEFANATNATLSGLISGVGNLTKSGAGTTILSNAANTYSGTTAVNGGTLLVDGAHNGAGNYTVGAGGTLGGIGAINLVAASNIITVNGTLVPGSATAIESLDIGVGDLALAGTANFQIDLTAATFDDVNVGNLLTYGGVLNVAFTGADTDGATFDIFDFASQGGAFSATNFSGLDSQQNASFDPATGIVTVSAVPEPAAAMAIASLSGLALVRRRRR
jgi:autotransporter-associated beta strand protein